MKKHLRGTVVLFSLLLLGLAAICAFAWDGGISGVGGTLAPMGNYPNIRMTTQRVEVELTPENADVKCLFQLHNDGPQTMVRMGFPEWAIGGQDNLRYFANFKILVGGVRVATSIQPMKGKTPANWGRWHVMSVRFGRNQTRSIRVHYNMTQLGSDRNGVRWFTYRLDTGVPWKGRIGKVDVMVNIKGIPRTQWLVISKPEGITRKDDILKWHWKSLEPNKKEMSASTDWVLEGLWGEPVSNIGVRLNPGYFYVVLNGRRIPNGEGGGWSSTFLEGQRTWTSPYTLARWFGAKEKYDYRENVATLTTAKHTIILQLGKKTLTIDGKSEALKTPCKLREGNLSIPVNDVFIALGGKARFDKKTGVTYLTLPPL